MAGFTTAFSALRFMRVDEAMESIQSHERASGESRPTGLRRFFTFVSRYAMPLFLSGVSIGWLVGLSVTPIVSSVVTVILALVAAVATLASGLPTSILTPGHPAMESNPPRRLWRGSPWLVTLLALGVAFGSGAGLFVRWRIITHASLVGGPEAAKNFQTLGLNVVSDDPAQVLDRLNREAPGELLNELSAAHQPFLKRLHRFLSINPDALRAFGETK